MKQRKQLSRTIGSAVLLFTLASTVAYVFSEENLFRPPASRSRSSTGMKEAESKFESRYGELEDRTASGRLQARELIYLLK